MSKNNLKALYEIEERLQRLSAAVEPALKVQRQVESAMAPTLALQAQIARATAPFVKMQVEMAKSIAPFAKIQAEVAKNMEPFQKLSFNRKHYEMMLKFQDSIKADEGLQNIVKVQHLSTMSSSALKLALELGGQSDNFMKQHLIDSLAAKIESTEYFEEVDNLDDGQEKTLNPNLPYSNEYICNAVSERFLIIFFYILGFISDSTISWWLEPIEQRYHSYLTEYHVKTRNFFYQSIAWNVEEQNISSHNIEDDSQSEETLDFLDYSLKETQLELKTFD